MKTNKTVLSLITGIMVLSLILVPTGSIRAQSMQPPAPAMPYDGVTSSGGESSAGIAGSMMSTLSIGDTFQNGANRLTAVQRADGGWGWPLTYPDGTPSATNTVGPIAQGLAKAFFHTIDPVHLAALKNAGAFLLTEAGKFSPSAGYLAVTLDSIFGGSTYTSFVKANYYDLLAAGTYYRSGDSTPYTTTSYVQMIRNGRTGNVANMATWDIGMGLVGAYSVGADTAPWVAGVEAEINELSLTPAYYHVSGLGAALYGLSLVGATFDPTSGPYASASSLQDLGDTLATLQISTGGFTWYADTNESGYLDPGMEAVQETAYAMLGLNQLDRTRYQVALQKATNYLTGVQLVTGGWNAYPSIADSENNEITGEALWAISYGNSGGGGSERLSDIYVCPVADGDCGHPGASTHSIQAAIDAVGHSTVYVGPGTYDEQVILNKAVTLVGAGDTTIIKPSQTTANNFTLFNRKNGGSANVASIVVTNTTEFVTIENLKIDGSLVTTAIPGAEGLIGILFRGNPGLIDTVNVTGIDVGNDAGLGMYLSGYTTPVTVTVNNSTLTSYKKNGITASYSNMNAHLTGNTITGMGATTSIAQNGIQISYGATATISGNTISGNVWTGTYGGTNDPVSDVNADGATGILLYMPGAGVEIDQNILTGNQFGIWAVAAPDVFIHDNTITGLTHTGNAFPTGIAIWSADMWTGDFGGTEQATHATITNNTFALTDYGILVRDYTAGGAVPIGTESGNTFDKAVTVSHLGVLQPDVYSKIQDGINAAVAGDTVNVGAGTYDEDLTINKSLSLLGAGASSTTIRGVIGGGSATIQVGASDVTIAGFTITRLGNTVAEWNLALNSAGIAIQGVTNTGMFVHDNIITGNRTGIDINNSSGNTISNNHIINNRSGMLFRNQTDNTTVTGNEITNNWTMGILFLDASSGTNVPLQTALSGTFSNNNLSGNWYGQVVDRQSGGSLPVPGTTNLKNFVMNWWGTTTPVVSTADSGEPGYASQIPVVFGGTAAAPGGKPDILGPASANIIYSPWCTEDTCNTLPPMPSSFYGYIHYSSGSPSGSVDAYVPGVTPAVRTATIDSGTFGYQMDVPGDIAGTSGKEGGALGETVTFKVGTQVVSTAPWVSGTNVRLDIHPPEAVPGGPYNGLVDAPISFHGLVNDWLTPDTFSYAWNFDGDSTYETLGQNPSHSWPVVGTYTVGLQVTDGQGGVGTAVATVNIASITLGSLSQTYDGSAKAATAITDPVGLTVNFAYSPIDPPVNVGSYAVTATITGYSGSATGSLVIGKASSTVAVTCPPTAIYTGSPLTPCSASYSGAGSLSGSLTPTYLNNTNVGTATANATYTGDANHTGSSNSATFQISAATASITLGNLNPIWDGTSKSVTYTTTPPGLVVDVTYNGSSTPPFAPGSYAIVATIVAGQNYTGSATATMHIQSTHSITLVPGWNLVSFNLHPMDTLTGTVLNGIAGKYDLVYGWDATGGHVSSGNWLKFAPGGPSYANSLTNMDETMGFWIHMSSAATLNVIGNAPITTNSSLSTLAGGWNLVGYASSGSIVLPDALSLHGVGTAFSLVYAYHANDAGDLWKLYDRTAPPFANDLKSLTNGWGYWVKVTGDNIWHVEY
jgi:parallel beta-helix repeat protein